MLMHKYGIMHYMKSSSRDADIKNILVGWIERLSLKHTCYLLYVEQKPVESGYLKQGTQSGTLWQPRVVGWGQEWEGGSGGWRHVETYVYLWLIHTVVWQKPKQHCRAIFLQIKKKNLILLRWKCSQINLQSQQNSFHNSSLRFCINWY